MGRKIWTAGELEQLTPAEQDEIFRAGIIWDLEDAPAELVERARRKIEQRIADTETTDRSGAEPMLGVVAEVAIREPERPLP